ncbi:PREDICTED: uncharacterized protein DDB_G0271670-like [Rhagoletis zephyria]|uniref:uncharacterized protein DDB_G0271670-like n=1 Tax=Rhagoletis zephyria TaxID=28612 RepID=UPI0008116B41|nr:PREDICTED: uncharacterized protein DDB_G0271670-like [Rhagoletis zephyria]
MPSTETIRSRQSIVSENAPYLGIFTTLASYKEKQLKELFATTVSPVKSSTEAILLPDYVKDSSPSLGKERVDKTSGFSTDSVDSFAEPTTTVSPLKGGFLYSHLKNRLQVSTTADYDQTTADLSTPATSVEDITDSAFPSNERFPKQSELNSNSESSTTSSRKKGPDFSSQAVTTSANIESIVVTPLEIASSSITTTSSSNIDDIGLVTTGTNWSPESAEIQSTTVKSSLAEIVKGESSVSEQEEVATENPTKQFIRELIALKERQGTLSTGANSTALSSSSEPSSFTSGSPLTTASSISSDADETHTSISVEVNTRSSISSQGPLFFFFTTTRLPAVDDDVDVVVTESSSNVGAVVPTEPTFERENRMLPFAFYNNQAVGKPVDEGHFVSSFQDFYSDTDIFKGMMPVYVSKITNMTNNVEMNSYWLGNNNVK